MLLAIDIGNSSISVGVFTVSADSAPQSVTTFKINSRDFSADELTLYLKDFLSRSHIYTAMDNPDNCDRVLDASVVSSVVPKLTGVVSVAMQKLCGKPPFIISNGIRTGFGIQIKNPEQLGTDIVCNSAAAITLANGPLVVLDMGTATTISVIDKNLTIVGTIIAPGVQISLDALYESAAQLSDNVMDQNIPLIGKDTKSSISSGVILGSAFMIDGFLRNIREELHCKETAEKLSLIATGGLAPMVLPYLKNKFVYVDSLTLQGAALLYQKNHKIV